MFAKRFHKLLVPDAFIPSKTKIGMSDYKIKTRQKTQFRKNYGVQPSRDREQKLVFGVKKIFFFHKFPETFWQITHDHLVILIILQMRPAIPYMNAVLLLF